MNAITTITIICAITVSISNGNPIDSHGSETGQLQFPTGEGFFQGDLKLTEEQRKGSHERESRLGVLNKRQFWPKNSRGQVVIPIKIITSDFTKAQLSIIADGLSEIAAKTCIRFTFRTNEADYVEYFSGGGCWSYVGRIGGRQQLSLSRNGCVYKGAVIHETVHAIGFMHTQNAFDRDNYIRVAWENMNPKDYGAFDKVSRNDYSHYGTTYDYQSIMHYGANTFSINGKDVMIPYDTRFIGKLGGGNNLGVGDAQRIKNMYGC